MAAAAFSCLPPPIHAGVITSVATENLVAISRCSAYSLLPSCIATHSGRKKAWDVSLLFISVTLTFCLLLAAGECDLWVRRAKEKSGCSTQRGHEVAPLLWFIPEDAASSSPLCFFSLQKNKNKTWKWMSSSSPKTFILIWYQIMPVYKPKSFAVRCTHSKQLPKTKTVPLFVPSVLSKAISLLCKSNEQKSEMP